MLNFDTMLPLTYLTYIALCLGVVSLWLPIKPKLKPWALVLTITLILAYMSNIANEWAILAILIFCLLMHFYSKAYLFTKYILFIPIMLIGILFELHLIPGFHNLLVMNHIRFSAQAIPFTLYLNLDKTIVGLIIIGTSLITINSIKTWQVTLKQVALLSPIVLLIVISLAFFVGFISYEPKLVPNLWLWIIVNLFFTCVAEEALFRGFIQEFLANLKYKGSGYIAMLVSALMFGIILHYAGGIKYIILSTVAGLLYALVYKITKRIEASILVHFLLNLTHILFFTYPALIPH